VILAELKAIQRKTCPFPNIPNLRDDFREVLVVEVEYRQRLKDGLRHAALRGLRPEVLGSERCIPVKEFVIT
jgi:hypothetical protein